MEWILVKTALQEAARPAAIAHLHTAIALLDQADESLAAIYVSHALDTLDETPPAPPVRAGRPHVRD